MVALPVRYHTAMRHSQSEGAPVRRGCERVLWLLPAEERSQSCFVGLLCGPYHTSGHHCLYAPPGGPPHTGHQGLQQILELQSLWRHLWWVWLARHAPGRVSRIWMLSSALSLPCYRTSSYGKPLCIRELVKGSSPCSGARGTVSGGFLSPVSQMNIGRSLETLPQLLFMSPSFLACPIEPSWVAARREPGL